MKLFMFCSAMQDLLPKIQGLQGTVC